MAAKLCAKPKLLNEFLEICKSNKYFAASIENSFIRDIRFLDHAPNLQSNIERQWQFKSKEIENSLKTYDNCEFSEQGEKLSLLQRYAIVRKRDRLAKIIPFGLIDIQNHSEPMVFGENNSAEAASIGVKLDKGAKFLTCSYLVSDKQSQEYFYRIQRLRKIWWMKVIALD